MTDVLSPPGGLDAERALASPAAMWALERLVTTLRSAGYANRLRPDLPPATAAAFRLALGHPAPRHELDRTETEALVAAGAADLADRDVVARFALFASGDTIVLLPRDGGADPQRVYFGNDSLWLAEVATRFDLHGGWYADLGTGAGAVMALVAGRHDHAIATDVLPRTAASASITARLNRRPDGRPAASVVVTDVACGLQPGTFTLVTANPPWVPARRQERAFADGGPSGFELPRRFVMEAAQLLAPGGVSLTLALDATWAGGARPVESLSRGLRRLGFDVAVVPTPGWPELEGDLIGAVPGVVAARHVALLVRRPD